VTRGDVYEYTIGNNRARIAIVSAAPCNPRRATFVVILGPDTPARCHPRSSRRPRPARYPAPSLSPDCGRWSRTTSAPASAGCLERLCCASTTPSATTSDR